MLDKRTNILLKYIVSNCETGSYTIIPMMDIINEFPKKYQIDSLVVSQILEYLKERNYIDIKHSDENNCCVCALPKARIEHENNEKEMENSKKIKKFAFFCVIFAFLTSFLGALLGSLLSKFIF